MSYGVMPYGKETQSVKEEHVIRQEWNNASMIR